MYLSNSVTFLKFYLSSYHCFPRFSIFVRQLIISKQNILPLSFHAWHNYSTQQDHMLQLTYHRFPYLKDNCSSGNKSSYSSFYTPGIIIPPYRNILYFNFLTTIFYAFQHLKDNCSSWNKSSFSNFYIPVITIPPYRNILNSTLLITVFHAFPYSRDICSSGKQNFSI